MDHFASIRKQLHLSRNDSWEWTRESAAALGRAILGEYADTAEGSDLLLAAALRSGDNPELAEEIRQSENPYVQRYLSDAVREGRNLRVEQDSLNSPGSEPGVDHPVALVQAMFYGDPARTGKGSSGGIATLLNELGCTMGDQVGGVVTLVLYNRTNTNYPLIPLEQTGPNHTIVRVPVDLPDVTPFEFMRGYGAISDAIVATLQRHSITPQILHTRFLDDASLAVARLAAPLGAKLVSTITPDPHRLVCNPSGQLQQLEPAQAMEFLNKVLIGDEIVSLADGILAIGRDTIHRELLPYFPQLEDTRKRVTAGIDEGVRIDPPQTDVDVPALLTTGNGHRLDPVSLARPAILCVGRLAPVKRQAELVAAWAKSGWQTHNLVLVGGDVENPSLEEEATLASIESTIQSCPDLAGRFCHLPATPNHLIRSLQAHYSRREPESGFDVYVCPSLKEEFGLSVVEAMASGMVACAPIRGGARTYIRHGVNGFLLDTRSVSSLSEELISTILGGSVAPSQVTAIRRNAARTVADRYSIEGIASQFSDYYGRVCQI